MIKQVISGETANTVRDMMVRAVNEGEAKFYKPYLIKCGHLTGIPSDLKLNKNFLLEALEIQPRLFKSFSEEHKKDFDILCKYSELPTSTNNNHALLLDDTVNTELYPAAKPFENIEEW